MTNAKSGAFLLFLVCLMGCNAPSGTSGNGEKPIEGGGEPVVVTPVDPEDDLSFVRACGWEDSYETIKSCVGNHLDSPEQTKLRHTLVQYAKIVGNYPSAVFETKSFKRRFGLTGVETTCLIQKLCKESFK